MPGSDRPAGKCLQLVRPIRRKVGRKVGLLSSRALFRSPQKIPLDIGSREVRSEAILICPYEGVLELQYGFLHALFSLQINPIMNVIIRAGAQDGYSCKEGQKV